MEYERIHKVQTGMISPSKLRMKLMGSHNLRKKDGSNSNSNSSRTSPSKLQDSDFVKNSLLLLAEEDEDAMSPSLEAPLGREKSQVTRPQQSSKFEGVGNNSSSVHPVRIMEDENLDYDSNASSSSFEFHRGERSGQISRAISRPVPSKWNDAEKWLVSRQNHPKRNALQNQTNRMNNLGKVAPESGEKSLSLFGRTADTKRVDFCQSGATQMGFDRFSFEPAAIRTRESEEPADSAAEESTGVPAIRSVSMRDTGTEMTPGTSLEPSMTSTPIGATTPIRSPASSMPSTPRGNAAAASAAVNDGESQLSKRELSEEELKLKTRKEILALGVRLGKMNIAAWASKEEEDKKRSCAEAAELERVQFEKRALVWEEAEKSKHNARYKREEIKIQAWESQQRAKLEAELRRIEAQVEEMRGQAQAKMVRKIAMTRHKSEEKLRMAEAKKARDAEIAAAQAENIRQTGRMPSTQYMCCGWL